MTKYFFEAPLVVIKALLAFVIHGADINDDIAWI